jgi:small conductance mechanosensitive channel
MGTMENVTAKIQGLIAQFGLQILAALAILVVGVLAAKMLRGLLRGVLQRRNVDETLASFIVSVSYVTMLTFVIIATVDKLGFRTTSIVAVIGAAGLAIGFALQGSLSNFAAGIMMIIFRPIKIGDFIEGGGATGVVEEIGIFTTQLKTTDNKKIIVPNSKMTGDNIINYSAKDTRRVDMVAGVSYDDDLDKVRKVIEEVLAADDRILDDPAPTIAVKEMADSSVNFVVRPWVKTADYWDVFFATQENIKKRFDAEGITIPFPQRDVHVHNAE